MKSGVFAEIDGIKLHYEEVGSGTLAVLLHGWGAEGSLFSPLAEVLSSKYRVIMPDFPGFGQSAEPSCPWSVSEYAALIRSLILWLGGEGQEVLLLGHSFGGRICIVLASDDALPFQIRQMILTGSAGILPKRSMGYRLRVGLYKTGRKLLHSRLGRTIFPGAEEKLRRCMGSEDYQRASAVMRQTLVRVVNEDLTALLPRIQASTLLIWGENDEATPPSDGKKMEQLIPDAGLVLIPSAGHYAYLDRPNYFYRVVRSFLTLEG